MTAAAPTLGVFAEGFAVWRKVLASVKTPEERWKVFQNTAREAATYVSKGLDKPATVDELQKIAVDYGLVALKGQDEVQAVMADAFEAVADRVPPPLDNGYDPAWAHDEPPPPKGNGKAKTPPAPTKDEIGLVRAADVQMKKIEWLWSNHLARGKLTMLSGDTELGKSQISTDWAARITKGSEWPDGDEAPLGSVVILSSEDAISDTIVPRLGAADADLTRAHCLAFVKTDGISRTFSLQSDLLQLGGKIRAIGDVLMVIIDPVTSYMGTKIDSHKITDVRAVLEPLQKFAEDYNVAVLMISHPQKSPATKAHNAVSGSGAFVHTPRMHFLVIKDPDNQNRTLLLAGKNNLGRKAEGLGYSIVSAFVGPGESILTSRVEWDNLPVRITANQALEQEAEKRKGNASAEASDFLRERLDGGASVPSKDLEEEAEARGISRATLLRARKKMGVRAAKDGFAAGWRLFLDKEQAGGKDS